MLSSETLVMSRSVEVRKAQQSLAIGFFTRQQQFTLCILIVSTRKI